MTIGERVYELLRDSQRPMTAREIATELHIRHSDVLAVLRDDFRFYRWPAPRVKLRKKLYGVASHGSEVEEQSGADV